MIFQAAKTRRDWKLTRRAVYAPPPAPTDLLEWSDATTAFDRAKHSAYAPTLTSFPGGRSDRRGLLPPAGPVDGGIGLNIIFPDTLVKMGVSQSPQPSPTGFHNFVPGGPVRPLR